MKIVLGFVATAALALAMGGCGSSSDGDGFGADPDLSAVRSRFDQPDGTLSEGNAARVLDQGTNGSSSTSDLNFAGGGGGSDGSASTQSMGLQLLDATSLKPASGGFAGCSALASGQQSGSCACPSGGSIDYVIRANGQGGGASNALMKFRLNACASGETIIDGTEYIDVRTDTTNQSRPVYSMLLVIDATVTNKGVAKKLDLQWRYSNGATEFAARVDDGWVVVSIKTTSTGGTWTVRDRNGSWTCIVDDGHGSCTSDKGVIKKF
jgi:hypothetical protein